MTDFLLVVRTLSESRQKLVTGIIFENIICIVVVCLTFPSLLLSRQKEKARRSDGDPAAASR